MTESDKLPPADTNAENSESVEKANTSGKVLIAVIVAGVLYVGASPFIGAMLAKNNEKTQIARAPEPAIAQIHALPEERTLQADKATQSKAIVDRFRSNISAALPSSSSSSSSSENAVAANSATKAEFDVSLKKITELNNAKNYTEGLAEADRLLARLSATPDANPQFMVAAAGLATQMADSAGQPDKTRAYSDIALKASRKANDFMIEKIEPAYYRARGSKVDFDRVSAVISEFQTEYDARRTTNLKRLAAEATAATVSLPAGSFFRLKATALEAFADLALTGNGKVAMTAFERIRKASDDAGDKGMVSVCDDVINAIKKDSAGH